MRGRRSGRIISFPVVVADYEGERYLVAMLGEGANWVSNARAAEGQAVLGHGRREAVRLEEVEPRARAPILRRYLQVAPGARPHIPVDRGAPLVEFEQIAAQYPVFRVRTDHSSRTTAPPAVGGRLVKGTVGWEEQVPGEIANLAPTVRHESLHHRESEQGRHAGMSDSPQQARRGGGEPVDDVDVVIVGAGFSGLYMLHRVRKLGLSVLLIEAGAGVGGTWYWNRYPGASCDVESTDYQYGFDDELVQEWTWTERYASQHEILDYLNNVADRLDLLRDIQFERRMTGAVFDERMNRWTVSTDRGCSFWARHCVMATGCLSAVSMPDFEGLDTFEGDWYHTARWPHDGVDFSGRRVAVIGTGSSAIQAIPLIAARALHLTVFQRTPNFSVPAHNRPRDPEDERRMKEGFAANRRDARESSMGVFASWVPNAKSALEVGDEERRRGFEAGWNRGGFGFLNSYSDLVTSREANEFAAEFVREKIRAIVRDREVAELLCPQAHPFGTKRLCVDTDYFQTYNRDNVTLVDVNSTPIEAITPRGVRTRDGEVAVDAIVFATGFDAMTGAVLDIDIRGRAGMTVQEKWAAGPCTYLGIQTAGFPNLFLITGPGSPSVLSNMIVSIEQHVDWVADCLAYLHEHDFDCIETTPEAESSWVEHVNELANRTLLPEANSWYTGANIPGKPRFFMPYTGGVGAYSRRCNEIAEHGYEGFVLSASRALSQSTP